jgi:molybdopterin converting factor small subunit
MKITLRYEAQARRACGVEEESIELPPGEWRVSDGIRQAARRHPETLGPMVLDPTGGIQPALLVFLGDEQVLQHEATPLCDGATLSIMTPISGG